MDIFDDADQESIGRKYRHTVLHLQNFLKKSGFSKVLLGLSGGIDSALTAVVASDAIGPQNVQAVIMPSCHTQKSSIQDAKIIAKNLGIYYCIISIESIVDSFESCLCDFLQKDNPGTAEENLQARTRGVILMTLANKLAKLVLATGNRSEIMTGYCTLYGDTCGAYAPILHLFKTEVYQLANWRNKNTPKEFLCNIDNIIPNMVISKEPTAELKPGQKDSDFLPSYPVLDKMLHFIIDNGYDDDKLTNKGFSLELINFVKSLVQNSKFKRDQICHGPPIIKL